MAINLSNSLNQYNNVNTQNGVQSSVQAGAETNTQSQAATGASSQSSTVNSGLQVLKDMLAGETFTGKVMNVEDGKVLLQLNNGKSLLAHLSDNATVQLGQNVTFMIEESTLNSISIRPLMSEQQQALLIGKALDAAQFPVTDANASVVRELLNLNMSISADTIADMIKHANKFPDANLNTIANLMKLEMPVTAENIAQFEAYKSYEHSITNELNGMVKGFSQLINGEQVQSATAFNELVNALYNSGERADGSIQSTALNEALGKESLDNLTKMLESAKEQGSITSHDTELINTLINKLKDGNTTAKSFLNDLSNLIKDNPHLKDNLAELMKSGEFNNILKQMIDETLKLNPRDIGKEDGIKKYYERIKDALEKSIETAGSTEDGKQLSADMQSIKSNIDFMNDLNKNMTYFQMPIKLQQGDANGELYVFTNKRALKAGSDNISALLHLDMDNLGPVDVYVKLAGKNVSTNFCLESEEMLDFVYSHIDKLNARLAALGYSFKFEMKTHEQNQEPFNFVTDFVEHNTGAGVMPTSQFVLDVKA